ncbi:hypothetical protein PHISCL_02018 [Aspergillus sclerotialis]|uniref:Uncharacterized protein n=1 Tax=Aspergillus sclerotialis TaxID=2070753 RepID=A0A3A3A6L2_9EURO|nr:hypothetical protein PHISCL_02018 [Aspergillus sclerotialis]
MLMKTAPIILMKLIDEMCERFSRRRGSVRKNDTTSPMNENTMVHAKCSVKTFIMIENVRTWLPITKAKKRSCAMPIISRPRLPKSNSPASAIL